MDFSIGGTQVLVRPLTDSEKTEEIEGFSDLLGAQPERISECVDRSMIVEAGGSPMPITPPIVPSEFDVLLYRENRSPEENSALMVVATDSVVGDIYVNDSAAVFQQIGDLLVAKTQLDELAANRLPRSLEVVSRDGRHLQPSLLGYCDEG